MVSSQPKSASGALLWERYQPLFVGVVVACAWMWIFGAPFPWPAENLFATAATLASVLAGFLGVAQSVVLTIKDTAVYRRLDGAGYVNQFFSYLRFGVNSAITFAALSVIGFFVTREQTVLGYEVLPYFRFVWVAAGALAVTAYLRVSGLLFLLLKHR